MTTPAGNGGANNATPTPSSTTRGAHIPNASGFTKKQQPAPPAALKKRKPRKPNKKG